MGYCGSLRVKICGITCVEDALAAANAGADAIGLVFYENSPRYVTLHQAEAIARAVGPFVCVVGLFVNAEAVTINRVLSQVPLQVLQFHGDESEVFCQQFQRPYMKAIRMKPELDVFAQIDAYPSALGVLLDAYQQGVPGGTGQVFDWQRVPQPDQLTKPIVLAGGLTPDNVQAAIAQTSPYAVDVSGGVESAPGRKDHQQVIKFIKAAKTNSLVTGS